MTPKVALAQDFLLTLAKLPQAVQTRVLKWSLKFQADPTSPGINYETIRATRDKNLRSVRIDQDWRGIVFKPDRGDVYVLMHVDKHDEAYRWAENRRVAVNPITGAMQLFTIEHHREVAAVPAPSAAEPVVSAAEVRKPLYSALSHEELLSLGTPEALLEEVRAIFTDEDLDALQSKLPVEAYEGLFLVAAGDSVSSILHARETRVDSKIDVEDFAAALETAESRARFVVVDDAETMTAIMNAPLAQWRVFLHPTQRKLATTDISGPMRVLGGAGTGKTVLAMHRAKWLAEHRISEGKKVLFTTFTKNLAQDIEENLKTLCNAAALAKIDVKNLDAWVYGFLRRNQYEYQIVYDRDKSQAKEAWELAMACADSSLKLDEKFYQEELEQIILAQGISTRDEYRLAKRRGRSAVLNRAKRDAIWKVFEEYRTQLSLRKLKEVDDAYRDAATLLEKQGQRPYQSLMVDETQDFGPQALRLMRAMVDPGKNDLFFVGDGHQRIYNQHRASMSSCGIDIRGRGRKLYLNYRTTEEIRRAAVALLEGCEVDDLDEGSDEVKRYKSISRGPEPDVRLVSSFEEALTQCVKTIQTAVQLGHSICLMVPSNHEAKTANEVLRRQGVETALIGPNEKDRAEATMPRIATMHRAKGLEFDEVILIAKNHEHSLENESRFDPRKLEYVAMTRAKQQVAVFRLG